MLGCAVSNLEQLGTTVNEQEVIFFNRHINTETGSYREEQNVDMLEFTRVTNTGKRGRPKKIIDLDFLREATSSQHQIKHVELAKIVHVHRETLQRYMYQHGIKRQYSNLHDHDLDALVKVFKCCRPESGFWYLVGVLQQQGVHIQHRRIWQFLWRVDKIGQHLRWQQIIRRRKYEVKWSNALWHLDGHHKMI
jgi:hypothetical protein